MSAAVPTLASVEPAAALPSAGALAVGAVHDIDEQLAYSGRRTAGGVAPCHKEIVVVVVLSGAGAWERYCGTVGHLYYSTTCTVWSPMDVLTHHHGCAGLCSYDLLLLLMNPPAVDAHPCQPWAAPLPHHPRHQHRDRIHRCCTAWQVLERAMEMMSGLGAMRRTNAQLQALATSALEAAYEAAHAKYVGRVQEMERELEVSRSAPLAPAAESRV
jgi:hypothetical protein